MQNKETLMRGNMAELWEKVRITAKSGDTGDLEKFIKEAVDKGKGKLGGFGGGLDQYFNLIPGGSEIIPKFQQLEEVTEAWGGGGEAGQGGVQILDVLRRKVEEAQKVGGKGGDIVK